MSSYRQLEQRFNTALSSYYSNPSQSNYDRFIDLGSHPSLTTRSFRRYYGFRRNVKQLRSKLYPYQSGSITRRPLPRRRPVRRSTVSGTRRASLFVGTDSTYNPSQSQSYSRQDISYFDRVDQLNNLTKAQLIKLVIYYQDACDA